MLLRRRSARQPCNTEAIKRRRPGGRRQVWGETSRSGLAGAIPPRSRHWFAKCDVKLTLARGRPSANANFVEMARQVSRIFLDAPDARSFQLFLIIAAGLHPYTESACPPRCQQVPGRVERPLKIR